MQKIILFSIVAFTIAASSKPYSRSRSMSSSLRSDGSHVSATAQSSSTRSRAGRFASR